MILTFSVILPPAKFVHRISLPVGQVEVQRKLCQFGFITGDMHAHVVFRSETFAIRVFWTWQVT